jgi:hypothetical protein
VEKKTIMTNSSSNNSFNLTRNNNIISDRRQQFPPLLSPPTTYLGLLQEFVAKLVLEVFGGGGAIWGFSEVCGLRTKETDSIRFWRSVAISVAVLFGVRWFRQIQLAVSSLLLHHDQKQSHSRISNNEIDTTRNHNSHSRTKIASDNNIRTTKSPIGIQLSSFLLGGNDDIHNSVLFPDNEEEAFLSPPAESSFNESTALATYPRSPKP